VLKEIETDKCQVPYCGCPKDFLHHLKTHNIYDHDFVPVRVATEESVLAERKELAEKLKLFQSLVLRELGTPEKGCVCGWCRIQNQLDEIMRGLETKGE
jgi:hypothetical protein